ncbi:MAG: hypothetical protein HFI70_03775 [Lachnospiraceae bacterium]|nr:hypothetical protein [Lachnospiraceae bacterium]
MDKFKDIKDKFLKKGESIVSGIKSGIEDKWGGFSSFWSSKKKRYYK